MEKQTVISRVRATGKKKVDTLVDRALSLDKEIKDKEKELKELKEQLRIQAEKEGAHEIIGNNAIALFSDTTEYTISIDDMFEFLKKNKKMDLLKVCIKPSITEIKKYIGEYSLLEFAKKDIKRYNKVRLSERKQSNFS